MQALFAARAPARKPRRSSSRNGNRSSHQFRFRAFGRAIRAETARAANLVAGTVPALQSGGLGGLGQNNHLLENRRCPREVLRPPVIVSRLAPFAKSAW
jgi:hypothetical protein